VRLRTAIEGFTGLDRSFQNLSICVLNGAREAKLPSELDAIRPHPKRKAGDICVGTAGSK
jgi:hypothetical protein